MMTAAAGECERERKEARGERRAKREKRDLKGRERTRIKAKRTTTDAAVLLSSDAVCVCGMSH